MKINTFLETTAKPALYEKGTKRMWTDSHISSQLLSVHLDGAIDLASRRSEVIESTVEWLLKQRVREKDETLTILDLGCGPGLYAESLARRGHRVTGMDFSARSIEYARGRSRSEGLGIDYRHGDYLKLDGSLGSFDLIIMIYTDFGVLDVRERKTLLGHVASCLKPGGLFIFDVLKDKDLPSRVEAPAWECRKGGFWLETPYLALSSSFLYEKERVILSQHAIWNDEGERDIYRFWTTYFTMDKLRDELEACGFVPLSLHDDVLPPGSRWEGDNVIFTVAGRKNT